MMHYSVGLLFCSIYDKVWRKRQTPTVSSALLLGGICGLLGIGVWKSVLHIHPDPPKIDRGQFYKQLLPAHLIFGVFSAAGYRLGDKAKKIAVSKTEDPN